MNPLLQNPRCKGIWKKKGSLQMENSTNTSKDMNSDISEVKPSMQATLDSGKQSSANGGKDPVQDKIDLSSDENNCPYSKYDKNEPEVKGPITSYPQYKEYWQEYYDKYGSYLSLKKNLEDYRNEINRREGVCEDAEARGDIYRSNQIREQTIKSYVPIFKKRSKIFHVLHAELQSIRERIKDVINEPELRKEARMLVSRKDPNIQAGNRADRKGSSDVGFQKGNNQATLDLGKSGSPAKKETPDSCGNGDGRQRSSDVGFQRGNNQALPQTGQKHNKKRSGRHNKKQSLRDFHAHYHSSVQKDKSDGDARNENIRAIWKEIPRNFTEGSNGSKLSQLGASPEDKIRTDLNKSPDDMNSDITNVKSSLKTTLDPGKRLLVKKNVDSYYEDSTKSHPRVVKTHLQNLKASNAEVGSQNKLTEMSSKFRNSKSGANQNINLDGSSGMVFHPVKESNGQTPHSWEELTDGGKDSVFADRDNRDQQKRESSLNENNCSYSKYDKDEPELKGPLTSYPQYEEGNLTPEDSYKDPNIQAENKADRQGS